MTPRADGRPTSYHVRVRDLRLHYLDFGGDGPPLLFLHATGFHAWVWAPYAEHFRATHRVLALDQRGHGESDKPPSGYRWEEFGADLMRFLDALTLNKPEIFIGGCATKLDEKTGELKDDATRNFIKQQLEAFEKFIARHGGKT